MAKIRPDDLGPTAAAVGADHANGMVMLVFPTPTKWVAMTAEQARLFAQSVLDKAAELDAAKGRNGATQAEENHSP